MNTLQVVAYLMGFGLGVGSIPLTAYLLSGDLPGMISEPLANLLMAATMFGAGRSTLHQTATGNYELRRASSDLGPQRHWSRFAGAPFGLTYAREDDAFGDLTADIHPEALEAEEKFNQKYIAEVDIVRNGERSFANVAEDTADDILIKTGEFIAQLRDSAGLGIANTAHRNATEEHGGDSSDFGAKWMLIGMVLFAVMGLGMGWVVFW